MALGLAESEANDLLDEFRSQTLWVQLHTGDPGGSGTSNQATEDDRKQVAFDAASGGEIESSDDLEWMSVAATEEYTHCSLWSDETSGDFKASGTITADEIASGGNFTIPAGDMTVAITTLAA